MSGGVSYVGNGQFMVTDSNGRGQSMNIGTMILAIRAEQMSTYDQQIADQYNEVKAANQKRKALNELMTKMRSAKEQGQDDEAPGTFKLEGESGYRSLQGWMGYYGITWTEVNGNDKRSQRDGQYDANIEGIKSMVDSVSSDTELMMLRLNKLTDDRSFASKDASNRWNTFSQDMKQYASGR